MVPCYDNNYDHCASCTDGSAEKECDGCAALVCESCWSEHNEFQDDPILKELIFQLMRIWPRFPTDPDATLPA